MKTIFTYSRIILFVLSIVCITTCVQAKTNDEGSDIKEEFVFDFENFLGEKISFSHPISARVNQLNLQFSYPQNYKPLYEASPHIEIYDDKGRFYKKFIIKKKKQSFRIKRSFTGNKVFAHISLFYCREGEFGICLFDHILYEIPLKENSQLREIDIRYDIKELNDI